MEKKLVWRSDDCLFCGGCIAVCPKGNVLTLYDDSLKIDQNKCSACGLCTQACPMGSLSLDGA